MLQSSLNHKGTRVFRNNGSERGELRPHRTTVPASQFTIAETGELESDLWELKRRCSEAIKHDFWKPAIGRQVEKLIDRIKARLAHFTEKRHDALQSPQKKTDRE